METEQRADNHTDDDVNKHRQTVFTDARQRIAVLLQQPGRRRFDFGQIVRQHIGQRCRQVGTVFRILDNRRQLAHHHRDMAAVNQVVHAESHQHNRQQHQAYGQRGRQQIDIVRVQRAAQEGIAPKQPAAEPQNQAVGAGNENIGQDNRQQQRQEMKMQHGQQRGGSEKIGHRAEFRRIGGNAGRHINRFVGNTVRPGHAGGQALYRVRAV